MILRCLRQMASRLPRASMGQAVLLTPLESFHPRPLPSSHRINRINLIFLVAQPFYFQTLAKCYSGNLLVLIFIQIGGGYTPHPASLLIACGREASANFFGIISFADPHLLTRIESYPYKNQGEGRGIGSFQSEESSEAGVPAAG
jgi:hypothetical protein